MAPHKIVVWASTQFPARSRLFPSRWCTISIFNSLPRRLIAVFLFALALPGCVPTTWLPDSSGFIYVKPIKGTQPSARATGGPLVHYDLEKKAGRVVVADIGPGTIWPAISPDGKSIAVARFKGELGKGTTVQIVLYDLQGKLLKESKELVWEPPELKDFVRTSGATLFWSLKNDMLVVSANKTTGLYSLEKGAMKVLDQTLPVVHAGTPVLPDGTGVLLMITEGEPKDKKTRLVVMDWAGTEQKINTGAFETAVKDKKGDNWGIKELAVCSLLWPSWWEGNAALAGPKRDKVTYKIDTAKKVVSLSEGFATLLQSDKTGSVIPIWFDFASGISVKLDPFQDITKDGKGRQSYHKVLSVNNKTGKEETLAAWVPGLQIFVPSPNGDYLALGLDFEFGVSTEPSQILVIDNKGALHSKIVLE
jgi:WD40-like Beta Propeller Repeat